MDVHKPLFLAIIFLCVIASAGRSQSSPAGAAFWDVSGEYIGSKQCAACHPAQAKNFPRNSMSHALEKISESAFLQGDIHYSWQEGPYAFSISREDGKIVYRVTDGRESFASPLEFAFGQGKLGQTYVYSSGGVFHESRASYYTELKGLDITVGDGNTKPANVSEAAGRVMSSREARDCFGCHTTGARIGPTLQLDRFEPGIQCEECHGPGGRHVASIRNGKPTPGTIRPLKGMDAQETSEFCGVCHRTWDAVMLMGIKGPETVRFAPYRLALSKCFDVDDRRIACTACHDPHGPVAASDTAYDSKCAACHNASNTALKKRLCPVAKQACTSCHMPRIEPPETHHAFADHDIRVVRGKDDYPG